MGWAGLGSTQGTLPRSVPRSDPERCPHRLEQGRTKTGAGSTGMHSAKRAQFSGARTLRRAPETPSHSGLNENLGAHPSAPALQGHLAPRDVNHLDAMTSPARAQPGCGQFQPHQHREAPTASQAPPHLPVCFLLQSPPKDSTGRAANWLGQNAPSPQVPSAPQTGGTRPGQRGGAGSGTAPK